MTRSDRFFISSVILYSNSVVIAATTNSSYSIVLLILGIIASIGKHYTEKQDN